ncbi:MAG: hypothetical protein LBH89_02960 [Lactococcus lactis]|jgi:hypothetical protein|nr:hypothetical protein [Lactococcus lactis]
MCGLKGPATPPKFKVGDLLFNDKKFSYTQILAIQMKEIICDDPFYEYLVLENFTKVVNRSLFSIEYNYQLVMDDYGCVELYYEELGNRIKQNWDMVTGLITRNYDLNLRLEKENDD